MFWLVGSKLIKCITSTVWDVVWWLLVKGNSWCLNGPSPKKTPLQQTCFIFVGNCWRLTPLKTYPKKSKAQISHLITNQTKQRILPHPTSWSDQNTRNGCCLSSLIGNLSCSRLCTWSTTPLENSGEIWSGRAHLQHVVHIKMQTWQTLETHWMYLRDAIDFSRMQGHVNKKPDPFDVNATQKTAIYIQPSGPTMTYIIMLMRWLLWHWRLGYLSLNIQKPHPPKKKTAVVQKLKLHSRGKEQTWKRGEHPRKLRIYEASRVSIYVNLKYVCTYVCVCILAHSIYVIN